MSVIKNGTIERAN